MIAQVKDNGGTKSLEQISGSIPTGNPVGTLLSRANGQVPRNYLECDGSTFNAGQYPALYLYLGTNVLPTYFDHSRLGAWETKTISTNSATPTIMDYDGILFIQVYRSGSQVGSNVKLFINGEEYRSSLDTSATNYWTEYITAPVRKGDSVYYTFAGTVDKCGGWFYKHHIYIKAVDGVDISDEDTFLVTVKNFVEEKNSYSTTEMLTGGKWIDGKPIYRRVFTGLSVSLSSNNFSNVLPQSSVPDIAFITSAKGWYSDTICFSFTEARIQNNYISVESTYGGARTLDTFCIEYTKTTD